jgi:ABC-2 type transport system permease protein
MPQLLRDTWLMFGSQLRVSLRNVVWLFIGLFQPICFMLLFAPLLKSLAGTPGFPSGNAYNVFTPGIMIMMDIYGAAYAGFGMIERLRNGIIERLRVTPMSRLAILLGMVAVDMLILLIQTGMLVVVGMLLGFRPDAGGLVLVVALLALGAILMGLCSYAVALTVKDQSALAATTNLFTLPLLLLSGIMLPLSLAPEVLQQVAKANPFSYAVNAARDLVAGQFSATVVPQAFIILGVLAVLALVWATQSIRKAAM